MTIPKQAVEAAARAMHDQFWLDTYPGETGTAANAANQTWKDETKKRRMNEARAALEAAASHMGVQATREDVARAVQRGRHQRCCQGRALDDVIAIPPNETDYDIADSVLALPHTGQPQEGETVPEDKWGDPETLGTHVDILELGGEGIIPPGVAGYRISKLRPAAPPPPVAESGWQEIEPNERAVNALPLVEELRERTALKYMGDCKCGKCQLVPKELIVRIMNELEWLSRPAPPSPFPTNWNNNPNSPADRPNSSDQREKS